MKEKIYTIPISEAFERPDGCPLCALREKLEADSVEYILGAAMMEPDVRMQVNRHGFCARHLGEMTGRQKRLSLALMLESILARLRDTGADGLKNMDCYVCRRVDDFLQHFLENIVLMWRTEPEFKDKLAARAMCLPHAAALLETSGQTLGRREQKAFGEMIENTLLQQVGALHGDVSAFCKSFDHRNASQVLGEEARTAVERAVLFLGGENPS